MKSLMIVMSLLVLASCSDPDRDMSGQVTWKVETMVVSDAQVDMLRAHIEVLLAHPPATLAGHDQDWDKAIKASYEQTRETLVRPVLVEYVSDKSGWPHPTGRWRPFKEVTP